MFKTLYNRDLYLEKVISLIKVGRHLNINTYTFEYMGKVKFYKCKKDIRDAFSQTLSAVLLPKFEPKSLGAPVECGTVLFSEMFFFTQVNVTSSRVPDHCIKYALSDPKDSSFASSCDHDHDLLCERCEELKSALSGIQAAIANGSFETENEKEDALYVFQEAVTAINNWKAHQLRVVNQDGARSDLIDCLSETTILLTQDWAMKFLPRLYRESQGEWFGKRGLSWHITVALRKKEEEIETQAFIHIVENCVQDSVCVVTLMEHVLTTLKKENPEIANAFYRQDNAGCYHCACTILACKNISKRTGVSIRRLDFSDPQGGKGPCDRFAATMKNHVRAYINEGHDAITAEQFQEAMLSHGGVPGARIALLPDPVCDKLNIKWSGISKLNNFEFTCDGVQFWRAYQVGEGKLFPWSKFEGKKRI